VHVPRVYWETTTARVLTLERIKGAKISDVDMIEADGLDRRSVADHAKSDVTNSVGVRDCRDMAGLHFFDVHVEHAMRRLSAAEQTVLLHCVQLGLSHDETAYVLAMPLGTVKTHALRGKAKLKTWLAPWHTGADEEAIR